MTKLFKKPVSEVKKSLVNEGRINKEPKSVPQPPPPPPPKKKG